jgi:lysophospholipase L1-like esterase
MLKKTISFDGRRVLIAGDSITDNGTYASQLLFLLARQRPQQDCSRVASIGLSSETLSGLSEPKHPFPRPCVHERLGRALEKFRPQVLVACYGMNDGIYNPQSAGRFQAFKNGVELLLGKAKAAGVEDIILMTPPPFDPEPVVATLLPASAPESEFSYMNPFEGYASVLEDYAKWLLALRRPELGACVDLNGALGAFLKKKRAAEPSFRLSPDGIHPGPLGHLIIALELLKALGVKAPEGSPETLLASIENDPAFKACDERRKTLSEAWRAFIGYTRDAIVRRDSIGETLAACAWNAKGK